MRPMLFVALLSLAPAAQASDTITTPAAAKPATPGDGDKLVCRREQVSGSNIPGKRICRLKSDLDAERAAARDSAKDMVAPQGGSNSSN